MFVFRPESSSVTMFLVLKRDWEALDGSEKDKKATIPAGRHEVERIPNPHGHDGFWLALKGTQIGASEGSWRQWKNGELANNPDHPNFEKPIDWGEFEVVIEE